MSRTTLLAVNNVKECHTTSMLLRRDFLWAVNKVLQIAKQRLSPGGDGGGGGLPYEMDGDARRLA